MDLLANELSVHGQFRDNRSFRDAIERLMRMRKVARRHGHEIHCARRFRDVEPRPGVRLEPALRAVGPDERRVFLSWLTRGGPFWDDTRRHGPDDWLECRDDVVTDTSVGEAAFRALSGLSCGLVSLTPSAWDYTPVRVLHRYANETTRERNNNGEHADLPNWRDAATLEKGLRTAQPNVRAWNDLHRETARYPNLRFAPDCLGPLDGLPFSDGAVREILRRLEVLNRFAGLGGKTGAAAHERRRLHQKHFHGRKAWFSDSSDEEKIRFRARMHFRHPERPGERLFCPWHGKVKIQQIRIHFSWPELPIHVVYIGQKITRR